MSESLKIVSLEIRNFMSLRFLRITPDPFKPIVEVIGENGAGKSATLESLVATFLDGKSLPPEPIRRGEKASQIIADLGELAITTTLTPSGAKKALTWKDGKPRPGGTHAILSTLIGSIAFDPFEFQRLSDSKEGRRKQREILAGLTGVGNKLDELEAEKAAIEATRKRQNAETQRLDAVVASIQAPETRPEPVDMAEIVSERQIRQVALSRVQEIERRFDAAWQRATQYSQQAGRLVQEITRLQKQLEEVNQRTTEERKTAETLQAELKQAKKPTFDDLDQKTIEADAINAKARAFDEKAKAQAEAFTSAQRAHAYTQKLKDIDAKKTEILAAAKMPVEGLGFSPDGVTFNGLPFEQACSGDQWEISVAIAMASNPRLRIILIKDGSLLDSEHFRRLEKLSRDRGFQVWIERVATWRNDREKNAAIEEPAGIILEDGACIAAETAADGTPIATSTPPATE